MQNCVVTNATGPTTGDVTTVGIACTTIMYQVSGTIQGLAGSNLVLQNNGGDNLTVAPNATAFSFVKKLDGGSGYKVAVLSQPSNPAQSCSVSRGQGNSSADVKTVLVTCSNISEWTWEGGPQSEDQVGTYGTKGTGIPTMFLERAIGASVGPMQTGISGSLAGMATTRLEPSLT